MLVISRAVNDENLRSATFLVGTEPGSGGCLDALNRRETRRARIAPTPSTPVEELPCIHKSG
jgi:hypothetical protein